MRRFKRFIGFAWLLWLPLLWWAMRGIPLGEIGVILRRLEPWQVLVFAGVNLGIACLLSGRWWLVLRGLGSRLPYRKIARYRLAGFGVNYFTPGPQLGGEPLLVYLLKDQHQLPTRTAITSVALDKLIELLSNFTFLVFGAVIILFNRVFPQITYRQLLPLALGLLTLPAGYLVALWVGWHPISWGMKLFRPQNVRFERLNNLAVAASEIEVQVSAFCRQKPGVLLACLAYSAFIWGLSLMEYWLSAHFLGMQLTLVQAVAAMTAARLAFMLPVPGGLGTLEASQALAMRAMGMDPALGISLSLLIRGRDVALAACGLWLGMISLKPDFLGIRKIGYNVSSTLFKWFSFIKIWISQEVFYESEL